MKERLNVNKKHTPNAPENIKTGVDWQLATHDFTDCCCLVVPACRLTTAKPLERAAAPICRLGYRYHSYIPGTNVFFPVFSFLL